MAFPNSKIIIIGILLVAITTVATAQKTGISDNQDVTTALSTDVTILDRVPLSPEGYTVGDTTRSIEAINSPARLLTLKYDAPSIRPLAMKRVQPKADYKKWLKLGFGMPLQPYAEGSYTSAVGARGVVGAYAKYHAANNSPALDHQRFEHILAQVNGSYYIDTVAAVTARIGYKNDGVNFYGYDHNSLTYSSEQTAQRFQKIYANLGLMNTSTNDADFDYKVNLDFYNLNDSYRAREQGIVIGADLTKWFAEKHPFNITIKNDYTGYNQSDSANFSPLIA